MYFQCISTERLIDISYFNQDTTQSSAACQNGEKNSRYLVSYDS